jgi:lipopolysaccharide export system protein LptA
VAPLSAVLKCRGFDCRFDNVLVYLLLWLILIMPTPAGAQTAQSSAQNSVKKEKVFVTADRLLVHIQTNQSEFIGNVKVIQGDTKIRADRMKVYYQPVEQEKTSQGADTHAINRIVARGRVKIKFGDRVAQSAKAEYIMDKGILILYGPGSKVTSGDNSITGSKITLYRGRNRIKVFGKGENRVKAVFKRELK